MWNQYWMPMHANDYMDGQLQTSFKHSQADFRLDSPSFQLTLDNQHGISYTDTTTNIASISWDWSVLDVYFWVMWVHVTQVIMTSCTTHSAYASLPTPPLFLISLKSVGSYCSLKCFQKSPAPKPSLTNVPMFTTRDDPIQFAWKSRHKNFYKHESASSSSMYNFVTLHGSGSQRHFAMQ